MLFDVRWCSWVLTSLTESLPTHPYSKQRPPESKPAGHENLKIFKACFFYSLAESPRHPCEMCRRRWKSRFVNPLASVQLTWPDLAPLFRPTLEGAWSGGQSARAGLAFDSGRTYGGHIEKTPQLWLKGWSNVEYHQMDFFGCVNG